MGASTGSLGTARPQYNLWQVLVTRNMPVVNQLEVMIANAGQQFDQDGRLTEESIKLRIQKLQGALVQLARQFTL